MAAPFDPGRDAGPLEPPRSAFVRVIQIVLLAALCAGAAVVSYMLVPSGSSDDQIENAGEKTPDAAPSGEDPNAAPTVDAGPQAKGPDVGKKPLTIIRQDGDSPPVVPVEELEQLSGEPPRVRARQMVDDDGNPVVIRAHLCINKEGKVTYVEIREAPKALVMRSQRTFKHWRYKPAEINGLPTAVCFDLKVSPRDS